LDRIRDWHWIEKHIECIPMADTKGIVALDRGTIVGAVVLDTWSHNSVQVHLGATNPMVWRRGLHVEGMRYVFETCDRGIILGLTPASNRIAIRFNKHIGFKPVYRIRDGFRKGEDLILFEMRKEDCRYLNDANTRHDRRVAA